MPDRVGNEDKSMENKNLEKGMDIVSKLLAGEQVSETGNNQSYYQEYNNNAEVYDFEIGRASCRERV